MPSQAARQDFDLMQVRQGGDRGIKKEFHIEYRGQKWTVLKSKYHINQFLEANGFEQASEFGGKQPTLVSLLFFEFFSHCDHLTGLDAFRCLKIYPKSVKVTNCEMKIDRESGKTVINFELNINCSQKGNV